MSAPLDALVFDTGPLRHFAEQGWLRILEFLAEGRPVLIQESVEAELKRQVHHLSYLQDVLNAAWIRVDRSDDIEFVAAFARYQAQLVEGDANRGECGVLALCRVRGFEAVIDDGVARGIAEDEGIRVVATLNLLCRAVRGGQLTVPLVEKIADDLLVGEYRLPFEPGAFRRWAAEEGLLDPY